MSNPQSVLILNAFIAGSHTVLQPDEAQEAGSCCPSWCHLGITSAYEDSLESSCPLQYVGPSLYFTTSSRVGCAKEIDHARNEIVSESKSLFISRDEGRDEGLGTWSH